MAKITDPVEIRQILDASMLRQPCPTIVATKYRCPEHPGGVVLEGYSPFACCTDADGIRKYDFGFRGERNMTVALSDIEYIQTLQE